MSNPELFPKASHHIFVVMALQYVDVVWNAIRDKRI
jgi:hypothetical protein